MGDRKRSHLEELDDDRVSLLRAAAQQMLSQIHHSSPNNTAASDTPSLLGADAPLQPAE